MIIMVLVLIIVTVVTIFSVQNASPVSISFFFWQFEASLAIIIFLSLLAGATITGLIFFSKYVQRAFKKPDKKNNINRLS